MIDSEGAAQAWLRARPECDDTAMARLEHFVRLLAEENTRQNLVAKASLDEVWRRHIVDSAQLLRFVPRGTRSWLDLGTGAGFPGLIAGVMLPETAFVLVESRSRRVEWLSRAAAALALKNVEVRGSRLEYIDTAAYDVISARAFAPLPRLLALSSRFSTKDTLWLLPKGRSAQQELDEVRNLRHGFHVEQSMTDSASGIIVGNLTGRKDART